MRGPSGGWLVGFNMTIGLLNILQVEARAVLEGMKLAWDRGFKKIEVEYDNALLIELIQNGWTSMSNVDEIRGIHGWCLKSWAVRF